MRPTVRGSSVKTGKKGRKKVSSLGVHHETSPNRSRHHGNDQKTETGRHGPKSRTKISRKKENAISDAVSTRPKKQKRNTTKPKKDHFGGTSRMTRGEKYRRVEGGGVNL